MVPGILIIEICKTLNRLSPAPSSVSNPRTETARRHPVGAYPATAVVEMFSINKYTPREVSIWGKELYVRRTRAFAHT